MGTHELSLNLSRLVYYFGSRKPQNKNFHRLEKHSFSTRGWKKIFTTPMMTISSSFSFFTLIFLLIFLLIFPFLFFSFLFLFLFSLVFSLSFFSLFTLNFFFKRAKHMFTLVLVAQCNAGRDVLTGTLLILKKFPDVPATETHRLSHVSYNFLYQG